MDFCLVFWFMTLIAVPSKTIWYRFPCSKNHTKTLLWPFCCCFCFVPCSVFVLLKPLSLAAQLIAFCFEPWFLCRHTLKPQARCKPHCWNFQTTVSSQGKDHNVVTPVCLHFMQQSLRYMVVRAQDRVQELCESRGGRPGYFVLTSLAVSVDIKQHWTMLRHWSQFVPNSQLTSEDMKLYISIIRGQKLCEQGGRPGLSFPFLLFPRP